MRGKDAGTCLLHINSRPRTSLSFHRAVASTPGFALQDGGGGGGGGDGWGWERTARNLLPNIAFIGLYFLITSKGGDGFGGGFFGEPLKPEQGWLSLAAGGALCAEGGWLAGVGWVTAGPSFSPADPV